MAKPRRWMVRLLIGLAVAMPLGAICLYLVNPFGSRSYDPRQRVLGYAPYRVAARDMMPALDQNQIVIMRAGHYRRHKPQRGDIVIFLDPKDGDPWIKRVIGLPGESIAINEGMVMLDGRKLVEDYVAAENRTSDYARKMSVQKVPEDSYFLLGDNRDNSMDGRMLGATHRDAFTGKVVAILE